MSRQQKFLRPALLYLLAVALAGCTAFREKATTADGLRDNEPVRGGTLQRLLQAPYRTLYPLQEGTPHVLQAVGAVYDTVLKFDPQDPTDSRIVPALAERWEQQGDRTYVFSFRKGVRWHDGGLFTAEDVRFTVERVLHPPTGVGSPRRDWFTNIERLEVLDALTLKMTLKRPQASFPSLLAAGWSVVVPKHVLEHEPSALEQRAIGTGPFRFQAAQPEVEGTLVRNEDYFLSGTPHLDGIRWVVVRDSSTQRAALRARRVDFLQLTNAEAADAIRREMPEVKVQTPASSVFVSLRLKTDRPPFNDVRVRQAFHLATDRDEVIRGAVQGFGYIASPMPPSGTWNIPEAELRTLPGFRKPKDPDLARARELLAAANYPDGFSTRMLLGQYDYVDNAGLIIADQLKPLGIRFEIEKVDFSTVLQRISGGRFETAPYLAGIRIDDPDQFLLLNYRTGGGSNWGGFSDLAVDDLLDRQSVTLDIAKRKDLVRQLNLRLLDQAPHLPLLWLKTEVAVQPWVKGYIAHGNSTNDYQHLDTWIDGTQRP